MQGKEWEKFCKAEGIPLITNEKKNAFEDFLSPIDPAKEIQRMRKEIEKQNKIERQEDEDFIDDMIIFKMLDFWK